MKEIIMFASSADQTLFLGFFLGIFRVPMMKSIGFVEENAIYFIVMLIVPNELRKNYG
jgi:hypothetical protein